MYNTPKHGNVAQVADAQTPIGVLRVNLLALIVGNDLFTEAEQLRANHNVHECNCLSRLVRWTANVGKELTSREGRQRPAVRYATATQKEEIKALVQLPGVTPAQRTQALVKINRLEEADAVAEIGNLWASILQHVGPETGLRVVKPSPDLRGVELFMFPSNKMAPAYPKGALVAVVPVRAFEDVQPGDVLVRVKPVDGVLKLSDVGRVHKCHSYERISARLFTLFDDCNPRRSHRELPFQWGAYAWFRVHGVVSMPS